MKTGIIAIVMLLIMAVPASKAQQVKQVTSVQADSILKADKKFVVLDVRTAEEFNAGHIKGAINIDIKQPNALAKIDQLDHKARYLVHCRTNHRSATAVAHMAASGFVNIYQISDGFSGWSLNGLPVEK